MEKKPDTPSRIARRSYEERNKAWRKTQNATFSTSMPRVELEKIEAFLKENKFTKVDLIFAGFMTLQERVKKDN